MNASDACANCGAEVRDSQYCGGCGERKLGRDEYSIARFAKLALRELTDVDAKLFRTIAPLLFKPGFLTAEYLAGRRSRYLKPTTLFVLLNVAFFLVGYRLGMFNWKLSAFEGDLGGLFQGMIDAKLAAEQITHATLAERFYEIAKEAQRTMFFFAIPAFGLILMPLFWRRYFVEHLIYSIHFHAYFLLFCITALPLLVAVLIVIAFAGAPGPLQFLTRDPGLMLPVLAGMMAYHCVAIRKVYDSGRIASVAIGVVLTVAELFILLYVFRPLMFLIVFAAV